MGFVQLLGFDEVGDFFALAIIVGVITGVKGLL
ncbi:MAG: hypothetical protein ACI9NY_000398 [Kiritimatiellia bacterium]